MTLFFEGLAKRLAGRSRASKSLDPLAAAESRGERKVGSVSLIPGVGRFISTASMVLSVSLYVPQLPERGSAIRAQMALASPGGSYTTLLCVRSQGVEACLAAPLGTGPNSFTVRRQLLQDDIHTLTEGLVGDIGVSLVMVENEGFTTTVLSAGVEADPTLASLEKIELHPGDMVHVSGADLSVPTAAQVLTQWCESLPDYVKLVVSVSPAVEEVRAEVWPAILRRTDLISMNIRESAILTQVLNANSPGTALRHVLKPEAQVVRRLGVRGCEIQENLGAPTVTIPAYRAKRGDTTGVGDTHVATMCARLLLGDDLHTACTMANAAAALMLSRDSILYAPTQEQILETMERGAVA